VTSQIVIPDEIYYLVQNHETFSGIERCSR
jgi:hypothetical protein